MLADEAQRMEQMVLMVAVIEEEDARVGVGKGWCSWTRSAHWFWEWPWV
jgi:hypothetical protein